MFSPQSHIFILCQNVPHTNQLYNTTKPLNRHPFLQQKRAIHPSADSPSSSLPHYEPVHLIRKPPHNLNPVPPMHHDLLHQGIRHLRRQLFLRLPDFPFQFLCSLLASPYPPPPSCTPYQSRRSDNGSNTYDSSSP